MAREILEGFECAKLSLASDTLQRAAITLAGARGLQALMLAVADLAEKADVPIDVILTEVESMSAQVADARKAAHAITGRAGGTA